MTRDTMVETAALLREGETDCALHLILLLELGGMSSAEADEWRRVISARAAFLRAGESTLQ